MSVWAEEESSTFEECVTIGGFHLKHTLLNLQDGNIKSSTTKIKDSNDLVVTLVHTIGKSSCSGLVDDPENIESSNLSSILGCLSLRVVEICRYSHHSIFSSSSKIAFSSLFHLSKHKGTHLAG